VHIPKLGTLARLVAYSINSSSIHMCSTRAIFHHQLLKTVVGVYHSLRGMDTSEEQNLMSRVFNVEGRPYLGRDTSEEHSPIPNS
jgi:sulfite exporter TauE/SafE